MKLPLCQESLREIFAQDYSSKAEETCCCSCFERIKALFHTLFFLIQTIAVPYSTLQYCRRKYTPLNSNPLDVILVIFLRPVAYVLKTIQSLAGTVIHPRLVFKKLPTVRN